MTRNAIWCSYMARCPAPLLSSFSESVRLSYTARDYKKTSSNSNSADVSPRLTTEKQGCHSSEHKSDIVVRVLCSLSPASPTSAIEPCSILTAHSFILLAFSPPPTARSKSSPVSPCLRPEQSSISSCFDRPTLHHGKTHLAPVCALGFHHSEHL